MANYYHGPTGHYPPWPWPFMGGIKKRPRKLTFSLHLDLQCSPDFRLVLQPDGGPVPLHLSQEAVLAFSSSGCLLQLMGRIQGGSPRNLRHWPRSPEGRGLSAASRACMGRLEQFPDLTPKWPREAMTHSRPHPLRKGAALQLCSQGGLMSLDQPGRNICVHGGSSMAPLFSSYSAEPWSAFDLV